MEKIKIKEAIVVEGRDDIDVVSKAFDTLIIATHGFGITKQTWSLIERAYNEKGIIILTDPDFSGQEIRRKLTEKFPNAKQAYMPRELATKQDDIGIENSKPKDVIKAVEGAKMTVEASEKKVSMQDIASLGLSGEPSSAELRRAVSAKLGIGQGNSKAFIKMVNGYGITLEEVKEATEWVKAKTKSKTKQ